MRESSLSAHILRLYEGVLQDQDDSDLIANLARTLAETGAQRAATPDAVDIASSGGPSSLSTLLSPLYLVANGLTVPKIGVPGRPAGGIDVLGTLEDYKTSLAESDFENALTAAHYAHAVADETWAPADAQLFRLRQEHGTQTVPALAVASLLAKKLAGGVKVAGLEARVAGHGNFGATVSDARRNADLYCDVASKLGMSPVVFLTDARVPFQPYLGRGEALIALTAVMQGLAQDPWLASHAILCSRMAAIVSEHAGTPPENSRESSPHGLHGILENHLRAQGSSVAKLDLRVAEVFSQPRTVVYAKNDGFAHYDLRQVREILIATQNEEDDSRRDFPDAAGLRLLAAPWHAVRRGDPVLEFRAARAVDDSTLLNLFIIGSAPASNPNTILEVVGP